MQISLSWICYELKLIYIINKKLWSIFSVSLPITGTPLIGDGGVGSGGRYSDNASGKKRETREGSPLLTNWPLIKNI